MSNKKHFSNYDTLEHILFIGAVAWGQYLESSANLIFQFARHFLIYKN